MDAVQAGWAETAVLQLLFLSSSLAAAETAQAGWAMTMDADVTETTAASGSFSFSSSAADAVTDAADAVSTEDLIF